MQVRTLSVKQKSWWIAVAALQSLSYSHGSIEGHNAYSSVIIKQIIDKAQSYSGINNPISTGVKESVAFCTAAANCKECGILTDGGDDGSIFSHLAKLFPGLWMVKRGYISSSMLTNLKEDGGKLNAKIFGGLIEECFWVEPLNRGCGVDGEKGR
ncbi:hypothetical protein C5167_001599 [Papaver somniferum]|uniref:Uncharacterized protein n=1 Tax=Papaver somniferum TaxID=3469 RepID=A0A4Y7KYI7_PAPSO|nr:hypothetical protein C5167_001599 [Papaver somniferum]